MLRKMTLILAVLTIIISMSGTILRAQDNSTPGKDNQQQKQSPFLITSELPHLTKLLIQQWDNSELKLTEEQKAQLLVVRKETISGVKGLAPQILPLQKQVAEGN
jgi:hypothetical protein